ncbi:MAG: type II secretion system protein GspG [Chitinophagaceae bacterium]|nr:type II secretion system protein GspG [Chitinophagaceae bacterium]
MSKLQRSIFTKIELSDLLARLQEAQQLYLDGLENEYIAEMGRFNNQFRTLQPLQANIATLSDNISTLVGHRNASELHILSSEAKDFLENIYDGLSAKPRRKKINAWVFIIPALVLAGIFLYPRLKEMYFKEKQDEEIFLNEEKYREQTLKDIFSLQKSLTAYYKDNNHYPESSGGWDAVVAPFGQSKNEWIPGLVPKYISKLPVDPRRFRTSVQQYMYKSNGKGYKLVAHYPVGMSDIINNHPELVDPVRPSWAFGVWTEDAKSW